MRSIAWVGLVVVALGSRSTSKEYVSGTTKEAMDKELDERLLRRIEAEVVEQLPSAAR